MAEGRQRSDWAQTSTLLALLANAHRDPRKTRAFKPSDFDPFARTSEHARADISALKAVFIDGVAPKIDLKEEKTP